LPASVYQISCSCLCPEPLLAPNLNKSKQSKFPPPLFPPIPITDILISSLKSILCVVHSRSSLSIYSLRSAQMIRYMNLNSSDHVVDICSFNSSETIDTSSSNQVEEQLIIGLLGHERMKIFEAISGSLLYDILTCGLPMIPSTEKILFAQIISLRNETDIAAGRIITPGVILLTSPGNLYYIPNLTNPRPIQLLDGESVLENDDQDEIDDNKRRRRPNVDHLYPVPTKIDHYHLPLIKSKSILILQTFRVLLILLIDSSKQFPQIIKISKISLRSKLHQRLVLSYPIEVDWRKELFRIVVVMSDGSAFIVTV
jgi:hypothetical protein